MLKTQNGLCAACQMRPGTQVDHDHSTRRVRAILCLQCNAALGALGDDLRLVYEAIDYLEGPFIEPESESA